MAGRIPFDKRILIEELNEQNFQPPEISRKIGIDTRTIKRYLRERVKIQSLELEQKEQWDAHKKVIRCRIASLSKKLELPTLMQMWISEDYKTGKPATKLSLSFNEGDFLEWELVDSNYVMKLDKKFGLVMQHLKSSRHRTILDLLDTWKHLGGTIFKGCHELRIYIKKESIERTHLKLVPGKRQRGLLDGFNRSIYWATFNGERAKQTEYTIASRQDDMCLLYFPSYNIAWLYENEIDRVKDVHQKIIRVCQQLSITSEISEDIAKLNQAVSSLNQHLSEFASLKIIPGKCDSCPK